jgi:hypothetical protein
VTFTYQGQTWRFATEHGMHGIWSAYRNLQRCGCAITVALCWSLHRKRPDFGNTRASASPRIGQRRTLPGHTSDSTPSVSLPGNCWCRPLSWPMLTPIDFLSMLPVLTTLLTALSIDPLAEDQPLHGLTLAEVCRGWSHRMTALFTGLSRNGLPANPGQIPASGFFAFLFSTPRRRGNAWTFSLSARRESHEFEPLLLDSACTARQARQSTPGTRNSHFRSGFAQSDVWREDLKTDRRPEHTLSAPTRSHGDAAPPPAERFTAAGRYGETARRGCICRAVWRPPHVRDWLWRGARKGPSSGCFSEHFAPRLTLSGVDLAFTRTIHSAGGGHRPQRTLDSAHLRPAGNSWPSRRPRCTAPRYLTTILFPRVARTCGGKSSKRRSPATRTHTCSTQGVRGTSGGRDPVPGLYCCGDWMRDARDHVYGTGVRHGDQSRPTRFLQTRSQAPGRFSPIPPPMSHLAWAVELA